MNTRTLSHKSPALSLRAQTVAALIAIAAAVILPQIFHFIGAVSGLGTAVGEVFLPMHLPVILVGMMAGPVAGAVSGLLAPAVSFALSGMPTALMLPIMMTELCAYGLLAGLMKNSKMPSFPKLLTIQLGGRLIRAAAVLLSVYAFNSAIAVSTIWMSSVKGLFGLVLQWSLIPLILYSIERSAKHE